MSRCYQVGDEVTLCPDARTKNELGLRRWRVTEVHPVWVGHPDTLEIAWNSGNLRVIRTARVSEIRLLRSVEHQVADKLMGEA